jgi:hypothetical protein
MTITLVGTHKLNGDGDIFAVWKDDMGSFTAIHDADGKPVTFAVKPPALSSEQLEVAQVHPAFELARKGIEARPNLESRMLAAAEMVEAGNVALVDGSLATVASRSDWKIRYMVQNGRCSCKDAQFRKATECAHALAVRMARSLGQEVEGKEKEEKRLAHNLEVAEIGRKQEEDWKRYMLTSAEGARRYARKVEANGGKTVKPSVSRRLAEAYGGNNV